MKTVINTSLGLHKDINVVGLLRPYWKKFLLAGIAVLATTAADLLQPWPLKIVLDHVVGDRPLPQALSDFLSITFGQHKQAILNFAVFSVAMVTLIDSVSSYAQNYWMTSIGEWVGHDLRRKVYRHIERLSLKFYDQKQTGDLISRMTRDIDSIQSLITSTLMDVAINLLTLCGMLGIMMYMNWRFSLIALAITPVLFIVSCKYKRHVKDVSRQARKRESEVVSTIQEVFTSIRVVKAFSREKFEQERFEKTSRAQAESAVHARAIKARLSPIIDLIVAIGTCLVLWYGARLVFSGSLTSGELVLFMMYLRKLYSPLKDLAKMTNTFSRASVGLEAIQEIMQEEQQLSVADASNESKRSFGDIEFDHVSFSYSPERQVLKDISLRIKPGQVAAFVGATGSGKSTIANLIPRFYEINEGTIRVDGKDVRDLNLESLRENISFVLQDTVLFHGPIWQNIAYGKLDATREEIIHAAQLANCHEFIRKMPEGYDTIVGERGVTLSGGQRQRIAIARAIIRNSPILILDEATAGLDAASEQVVMDALTNLMRGRTCLINAHRLSTIRHADVIFVLQEGKIVDSGTHNELISREGIYAMLHRIQFRRTEFEELVGYGTPLPSPEELDRPLELAAHA